MPPSCQKPDAHWAFSDSSFSMRHSRSELILQMRVLAHNASRTKHQLQTIITPRFCMQQEESMCDLQVASSVFILAQNHICGPHLGSSQCAQVHKDCVAHGVHTNLRHDLNTLWHPSGSAAGTGEPSELVVQQLCND